MGLLKNSYFIPLQCLVGAPVYQLIAILILNIGNLNGLSFIYSTNNKTMVFIFSFILGNGNKNVYFLSWSTKF